MADEIVIPFLEEALKGPQLTEDVEEQSEPAGLTLTIPDVPVRRGPGRPRGSRNQPKDSSPKDVDVLEGADLPRRRGRPVGSRNRSSKDSLTADNVATLVKMAHTVGSAMVGPEFAISDEGAKAIGEAAIPVIEDYGIQVASKAMHLILLVSTVVMIEGPIMVKVAQDMQAKVQAQRSDRMVMGTPPPTPVGRAAVDTAQSIAAMTGVAVGSAPDAA